MNCECQLELDPERPIQPASKNKIGKHSAAISFAPKFSKKPKCKGENCDSEVTYKWTISPTEGFVLQGADKDQCVVIGNGEFELTLEVTLRCFEALDAPAEDEDDGPVWIQVECDSKSETAKKKFRIKS